jgi:hypothetical protein
VAVRAGLRQRVAQRGQLVGDVAPRGVVELGLVEIVARDVEEPRGDRAARRRIVAGAAAGEPGRDAGGENDRDRTDDEARANQPRVFGSARVRVKEV